MLIEDFQKAYDLNVTKFAQKLDTGYWQAGHIPSRHVCFEVAASVQNRAN